MSGYGTSLFRFKRGLHDALGEVPGLADVQVLYAQSDDTLSGAAIWLAGAETEELGIPSMRADKLHLQEVYELKVMLQVTLTDGESQEDADARLDEIFAELQQVLARAPRLIDDIQWARPCDWKYVGGQLGTGPGHGARLEIVVRVSARME